MQEKIEDKKILFITGLHRSGTSKLHSVLRSHPRISGFRNTGVSRDEGQHLQSVYPTAEPYGGPGIFGFDSRAYLDENSPLLTPANREKLLDEWLPHWDLSKDILVEKSPPHLIRTRFLQTFFPAAAFLFILRHPLATALATQKWSETSIDRLLEHWLLCHEAMYSDKEKLHKYLIFAYEKMVSAPGNTFQEIFDFLKIPSLTPTDIRDDNRKYFRKRNMRYLAFLYGGMRRRLTKKYEERINRFGYSLLDLTKYPVTEIHS